ncbi:MAG: alpha/beta fold hydrolase [Paracoccaceae bacterium]|nr:MAG: alpha/beta fold hydrolase [Paracoccaceae bacterium]
MSRRRWLILSFAFAMIALAIFRLEAAREGIERTDFAVGGTPATAWRLPGAEPAPAVVIAHGFAGSRQLMEGFAVTLARAGYVAVAYDLAGHGRNPVPMSGDPTVIEGTTQVLMDELARVADAALALPGVDGRLALVGHSMASDIVVRQAIRDPRVGAVVAVSMFSAAVTPEMPRNLLVVAGAWERFLSAQALAAVTMRDPAAAFGQTLGEPVSGSGRRAVQAPGVEHVGVLYSATTLGETRGWLDAAFGRESRGAVALRGGWIVLLLGAVMTVCWIGFGAMDRRGPAPQPVGQLSPQRFAGLLAAAGIAVPVALRGVEVGFLPVLVADYLMLHMSLYGFVVVAGTWRLGLWRAVWPSREGLRVAALVALFGIGMFGWVLETYVASFWSVDARGPVVVAMIAGAVPFMIADAILTEGGRAPLARRIVARSVAILSLGLAVALDFERLMFLVIVLPVILLFFLLFGALGSRVARATGRVLPAGAGLGLYLGWALGVTFPLFQG